MEYLGEILDAFKRTDSRNLRSVSDKVMVNGFIQKNPDLIRLAVLTHSLSKVVEKEYYKREAEYWGVFVKGVIDDLSNIEKDKGRIASLEKSIVELDQHFGRYKENVLHQSKIRKGSTLYAWGVSLTLASKMVGVPEYELMKQIGRTKIVDEEGLGKHVSDRLRDAEEIL